MSIEWVLIKKFKPEPIGAVGFIGNDIAVVTAFFDDADFNQDGEVTFGEKIGSKLPFLNKKGRSLVEVAMQARVEPDVMMRDASINQIAGKLFVDFASDLVMEGIYQVYFARGVKMAGAGVAKTVTSSTVKQLIVRKGFEKAAKEAFEAGTSF